MLISARLSPVAFFSRHSEQTGARQVDAENVGGTVCRSRRCRSCGDCAGRHGSRNRSCGVSTEAAFPFASMTSSRDVLAMQVRELSGNRCTAYKPRRTRCCCSTARARQSRRRRGSEEVVEHEQGLDSRFVSGGIQAGDLPCGESGVPPIGYAKLSAMKNRTDP